ncbi:MAG: hypothetical protein ACREYF_29310 [Gammaproteobacteria bacterium]
MLATQEPGIAEVDPSSQIEMGGLLLQEDRPRAFQRALPSAAPEADLRNGGVRVDDPNADPNARSTNTVDLTVESGAGIHFDDDSFVNSFTANGIPVTSARQPQPITIFHDAILVEDADGATPPIFPEPQLPGRFGPTFGGRALGLAQALAIASAVEETQREDETACGEGGAAESGEGQGEGDACAPTAEAETEDLYAIESGSKRSHRESIEPSGKTRYSLAIARMPAGL